MGGRALYSIRVRFLISLGANLGRGALNFLANMLMARFLLPHAYGELSFLLTSFVACTQLFDQGVSSAFYTFISREKNRAADFFLYFAWILFQVILLIAFIWVVGSDSLIHLIWGESSRELILLALLSVVVRQLLWVTVTQVGEAQRKTVMVQIASMVLVSIFLGIILLLQAYVGLSIHKVFYTTISVYGLGCLSYLVHWKKLLALKAMGNWHFSESLREYFRYCRPLVLLGVVTFFYTFLDNWMLNHFAGAIQQGYYQVANQFMSICLLVSTSMLKVFWKELTIIYEQGSEKAYLFFKKVYRLLLVFSACVACFLIPWVKDIVLLILGKAYLPGANVLGVMFLYAVFSGVSQAVAVGYMASSKTVAYAWVNIVPMAASIPITYLLLAPHYAIVPGASLGAMGLAIKIIGMSVLGLNLKHYVLCRLHAWKFDWGSQWVCIAFFIILSYLVHFLFFVFGLSGDKFGFHIVLTLLAASGVYGVCSIIFILFCPKIFLGMSRADVLRLLKIRH